MTFTPKKPRRAIAAIITRIFIAAGCLTVIALSNPTTTYAKPKKPETCEQKHSRCNSRCLQRYPEDHAQQNSCFQRTCQKQRENCDKAAVKDPKPGLVQTPPVLDKPQGRPPSGGLLDTTPHGIPSNKPAPTGTAAPN